MANCKLNKSQRINKFKVKKSNLKKNFFTVNIDKMSFKKPN